MTELNLSLAFSLLMVCLYFLPQVVSEILRTFYLSKYLFLYNKKANIEHIKEFILLYVQFVIADMYLRNKENHNKKTIDDVEQLKKFINMMEMSCEVFGIPITNEIRLAAVHGLKKAIEALKAEKSQLSSDDSII